MDLALLVCQVRVDRPILADPRTYPAMMMNNSLASMYWVAIAVAVLSLAWAALVPLDPDYYLVAELAYQGHSCQGQEDPFRVPGEDSFGGSLGSCLADLANLQIRLHLDAWDPYY